MSGKNADFLSFIRGLPCCSCGAVSQVQAAHVRILPVKEELKGGTGKKPADFAAVPLCFSCHSTQHQKGERTFWANKRVEPIRYAPFLVGCFILYRLDLATQVAARETFHSLNVKHKDGWYDN